MSGPQANLPEDERAETKRRIRAMQDEIGVLQDSRRPEWLLVVAASLAG